MSEIEVDDWDAIFTKVTTLRGIIRVQDEEIKELKEIRKKAEIYVTLRSHSRSHVVTEDHQIRQGDAYKELIQALDEVTDV